ncbi:hypothetical protein Y032_0074g869 [Ancylostoma ceylanicum]|uniref:Uncharacterized protein n=1 Tax=Ancylostoma ceylanicum TaxID=53326 RepID=A0A016TWK0_9BILA|nr:hypothetical protein Y032_0074g869 [Ancylostoma ceylanicum]
MRTSDVRLTHASSTNCPVVEEKFCLDLTQVPDETGCALDHLVDEFFQRNKPKVPTHPWVDEFVQRNKTY